MEEEQQVPEARQPHPGERDGWMPVVMGQVCQELVPRRPEPPEATEDELTLAALADPADVAHQEGDPRPTFWRVLVLVFIAVGALSIVFHFAR